MDITSTDPENFMKFYAGVIGVRGVYRVPLEDDQIRADQEPNLRKMGYIVLYEILDGLS